MTNAQQAREISRGLGEETYCRHGKTHQPIYNCEACTAKVVTTALDAKDQHYQALVEAAKAIANRSTEHRHAQGWWVSDIAMTQLLVALKEISDE